VVRRREATELLGLSFSASRKELADARGDRQGDGASRGRAALRAEPTLKTKLASDYVFANESTRPGEPPDVVRRHRRPDARRDWLDKVRSVQAGDVAAAARRWFGTKTATASFVVPEEMKEKA